jgi:hypothetical protein
MFGLSFKTIGVIALIAVGAVMLYNNVIQPKLGGAAPSA